MKPVIGICIACALSLAGIGIFVSYQKQPPDNDLKPKQSFDSGPDHKLQKSGNAVPSTPHGNVDLHLSERFIKQGWSGVVDSINAEVPPADRMGRLILAASMLIRSDPSCAGTILGSMPFGAMRQGLIMDLANGVSTEASRQVLGWTVSNGFPEERESLFNAYALRNLDEKDEDYIDYLLKEKADPESQPLLVRLKAQALVARGALEDAAALFTEETVKSLPTGWPQALIGGMKRSGHLNADELSKFPVQIQNTGWQELTYDATVGTEATGLKWVSENVPSQFQIVAAGGLISRWLQIDPDAASQAVRSLPSGDVRNAGIKNIVGYLRGKGDVALAGEWEAQISNPR